MWQSFTTGAYQNGLELDSNIASHPIEVPVKRASDINQIFDSISYNKGCAVIRMIASYLGVEVFIQGVCIWLNQTDITMLPQGLWSIYPDMLNFL